MRPQIIISNIGLAGVLFLSMVGAMNIGFDVAGGELSPRTVYIVATVFALLMTPIIRRLDRR